MSSSANVIGVKHALVSVFDKTGIEALGLALEKLGVTVLSTGGTAKRLRDAGVTVTDVSEVTKSPEMLGGRVKTLHPAIHGGLLANRADADHMQQLEAHGIEAIDMVVCNLYPFEKTVASGKDFGDCIEMIDIGGPTMVRAAAKNCDSVAVVTDPSQYEVIVAELEEHKGTTKATRRSLARAAFMATSHYDSLVAAYLSGHTEEPAVRSRQYVQHGGELKYGVNPHQKPATVSAISGRGFPFVVKNGAPGYTNIMDALNAWQLVKELSEALDNTPAAASFKHVSPAGAAVAAPLSDTERKAYEVEGLELSDLALAYVRARNADPMSSYGDFVALSGIVDVPTAKLIKREVSDGVIAAGYTPEALELLKSKKGGRYLVLEAVKDYEAPEDEIKEVYGAALTQRRNDASITPALVADKVVTSLKDIDQAARRDLVVATITVKYTQSNSVCYAAGGQIVGVGAGQQSRVDCVKLAGRKVDTWWARQHPKVLGLNFKEGVKRAERVNARVAYIADDMTPKERAHWETLFVDVPEPFTAEERTAWMGELKRVALSSDAFFPFRDNIDQASKHGVQFITQPGGSVQDEGVVAACDEYGMTMAFSGIRLFHH